MHFVFYRTSDVFAAEEELKNHFINTSIVPTPVQDKAYCGVCVRISEDDLAEAKNVLINYEYQEVL